MGEGSGQQLGGVLNFVGGGGGSRSLTRCNRPVLWGVAVACVCVVCVPSFLMGEERFGCVGDHETKPDLA